MEKFAGAALYDRPFHAYIVPETAYHHGLWREPAPGDFNAPYGLAAGYHSSGEYAWLSTPNGVWRASLASQTVDISADVAFLEMSIGEQQGRLMVELDNQDNRYADFFNPEESGYQLVVSTGYRTAAGNEAGSCRSFVPDGYEHTVKDSSNIVRLKAGDGWTQLKEWQARDQWRWNKAGREKSIRDILAFVLSRAGLRLETRTESAVISASYPDFTIHPLDTGSLVVERLLEMVPDRLIVENGTACLVYPQALDSPCYRYGESHPILEGKYFRQPKTGNWVRVTGYDPAAGGDITADFFNWPDLKISGSRYSVIHDVNLNTIDQLEQRGEMLLRNAGMKSASGLLVVPANCGQELYDVVEIADARGFSGARRINAMSLVYDPARGRYIQQLVLGGV
jgi:hypothetical protein